MTPFGIVLLILAVGGYFAVVHPRTSRYPMVRRAVVLGALLLIPATGWHAWSAIRSANVLAAHVEPYPKAVDILAQPENAVRFADARGTWVLQTTDEPAEVLAWYRDPKHHRDWTVRDATAGTLLLERADQRLHIWASRQRPDATTIVYQLEPPPR